MCVCVDSKLHALLVLIKCRIVFRACIRRSDGRRGQAGLSSFEALHSCSVGDIDHREEAGDAPRDATGETQSQGEAEHAKHEEREVQYNSSDYGTRNCPRGVEEKRAHGYGSSHQ